MCTLLTVYTSKSIVKSYEREASKRRVLKTNHQDNEDTNKAPKKKVKPLPAPACRLQGNQSEGTSALPKNEKKIYFEIRNLPPYREIALVVKWEDAPAHKVLCLADR